MASTLARLLLLAALPSLVLQSGAQAPEKGTGDSAPSLALGYVTFSPGPQRFPLARSGVPAPIVVSPSDLPGVSRAVSALGRDLSAVTGGESRISAGVAGLGRAIVLVGTLGHHPLIDRLVRERKLDVSGVAGAWETWVTQVVRRPLPGVDEALVIAGSDRRGTIFGAYDLSAEIGVSPWYWWADVPVPSHPDLFVAPGRFTRGTPAVRYRGIFINDEAPALSRWARATFGGFNARFYEQVFELILRLRGNYLWPAMWGSAFADDDTASARLADEYGVVMGTSHHEPLTRAQAEWRRYGSGEWNYERNPEALRTFWRGGIERMGTRENIVTVGMRGDGDMPMTEGANIALLERIVRDQRQIIGDVTAKDPAETPQLWALYKEVQEYYDRGMRVPDDITLLFADDNWGNIRRLNALADSGRRGGFGVYYHFDYVGGPRNYKWLNTNPVARVWEQLHLAWRHKATRIWIVNVGDIKPMEYPTSFFLDFAWDPSRWTADRLETYAVAWARQQFGDRVAPAAAAHVTTYLRYAGRRKPELLTPETYSLSAFGEALRVDAEWRALQHAAESTAVLVPPKARDAYYQLVLHPIQASANLNQLYYATARNRQYALEGRAATNLLADSAQRYFERDAEIAQRYHALAGGKWPYMMSQTHIGYTYWQEPPRNVMPRVDRIEVPPEAELGVSWEGQPRPGPAGFVPRREGVLPEFDAYRRQVQWVTLYNRGAGALTYSARASEPWVVVQPAEGAVGTEVRVAVAIDWERVPVGRTRVPLTITGSDGRRMELQLPVHRPAAPVDSAGTFVQGGAVVSMEASHFTRAVATAPGAWQVVPGLGRTLAGVMPLPVTTRNVTPSATSPRLEYRVVTFDSGEVRVRAYFSPSLNFSGAPEGLRYAIAVDDEPPQVVNITPDSSNAAWERSVADNIRIGLTRHRVARPGPHVIRYWMVDAGVVLQKLVLEFGDVPPTYLGPPESHRIAHEARRR